MSFASFLSEYWDVILFMGLFLITLGFSNVWLEKSQKKVDDYYSKQTGNSDSLSTAEKQELKEYIDKLRE